MPQSATGVESGDRNLLPFALFLTLITSGVALVGLSWSRLSGSSRMQLAGLGLIWGLTLGGIVWYTSTVANPDRRFVLAASIVLALPTAVIIAFSQSLGFAAPSFAFGLGLVAATLVGSPKLRNHL